MWTAPREGMKHFPSSIMADLLDNNGRTAPWMGVHKLETDSPLAEISQEMFRGCILIQPGYRIRLPSKITEDGQHIAARPSRPQLWWSVHIAIDHDVECDQACSKNSRPALVGVTQRVVHELALSFPLGFPYAS